MWDKEQRGSFEEVKRKMSGAYVLAYYDKNAETVIIRCQSGRPGGGVVTKPKRGT